MLTKSDIKIIEDLLKESLKDRPTKADLKSFATKDDLIQFKDEILGEIQDLRDDVAVVGGYRDMIEDHEQRVTKLEEVTKSP